MTELMALFEQSRDIPLPRQQWVRENGSVIASGAVLQRLIHKDEVVQVVDTKSFCRLWLCQEMTATSEVHPFDFQEAPQHITFDPLLRTLWTQSSDGDGDVKVYRIDVDNHAAHYHTGGSTTVKLRGYKLPVPDLITLSDNGFVCTVAVEYREHCCLRLTNFTREDDHCLQIGSKPTGVAVSRDGSIVTCACGSLLYLWRKGEEWDDFYFYREPAYKFDEGTRWNARAFVSFLFFNDDTSELISCGPAGRAEVFTLPSSGKPHRRMEFIITDDVSYIRSVAVNRAGTVLASSCTFHAHDFSIKLWSLTDGTLAGQLDGHENIINKIIFTRDDTMIISASSDRTVRVWDLETGGCGRTLMHGKGVHGVTVSSDARWIATCSHASAGIVTWSLGDGDEDDGDGDDDNGAKWKEEEKVEGEKKEGKGEEGVGGIAEGEERAQEDEAKGTGVTDEREEVDAGKKVHLPAE